MRRSTAGACLALALACTLPFQPWAPSRSGASFFEVTAESDEPGVAKLYYDVGRGFNEADTSVQALPARTPEFLPLPDQYW